MQTADIRQPDPSRSHAGRVLCSEDALKVLETAACKCSAPCEPSTGEDSTSEVKV